MLIATAFILGAFIGSFLNVCIHRLPRNESVVMPPSRCYACGTHVQWYDNIPMVSYLILRGMCRWCKTPFSPRYLFIEAFVGAVTAAATWYIFTDGAWIARWAQSGDVPLVIAQGCALTAVLTLAYFLIVALVTDIQHLIIPDELTKSFQVGAPFLAALCSTNLQFGWHPGMWLVRQGAFGLEVEPMHMLWWFVGTVGACIIFLLASLPLARWVYSRFVPESMRWREEDHRGFRIGVLWFIVTLIAPTGFVVGMLLFGSQKAVMVAAISLSQAVLGGLAGWMSLYVVGLLGTIAFRRNAMGFGDVKFLAPIGCFLGPVGVIYAFFAAALVGAVIGTPMRLMRAQREIPFGPYLALGAVIIMIWGVPLHGWLFARLLPHG